MKKSLLRALTACALASVLAAGNAATAFAYSISSLNLELSGETPRPGRELGEVEVTEPSDAEYWVESAEYINNSTFWTAGELPVIQIELRTDEDNTFTVDRDSAIRLKGLGATLMQAYITFEDEMTVYAQLPVVSSDGVDYNLSYTSSLSWDNKTAVWKNEGGDGQFQVQLARGDEIIQTVKTSNTSYSFLGMMGTPGSYYFRIRRVKGSSYGEWTEWSKAYTVYAPVTGQSSGNYAAPAAQAAQANVSLEGSISHSVTPGWKQDAAGWWYQRADGSYVSDDWLLDNGKWYLFDGRGYMLTGWQKKNGADYYLGSDGAMLENCWTPDGWYVGPSGAWDASVPRRN